MEIIKAEEKDALSLAPLAAAFRVELNAFKNIVSNPDLQSGLEEIQEYFQAGYPVYTAVEGTESIGYMVCRVEDPIVWVESLYVKEEYRRKGIASALFEKAEALAESHEQDTLFQYVHPNNQRIINFLRNKGYTVLNLIEIRRPFKDEKLTTHITVGDNRFDY